MSSKGRGEFERWANGDGEPEGGIVGADARGGVVGGQ